MNIERFAFKALIKGLKAGWDIPDEAVREGITYAAAMVGDDSASKRDRLRAAEMLVKMSDSRQHLLLATAKQEIAEAVHDANVKQAQEVESLLMPSCGPEGLRELIALMGEVDDDKRDE